MLGALGAAGVTGEGAGVTAVGAGIGATTGGGGVTIALFALCERRFAIPRRIS